jgi:isoleucyl-tRNA synthetase
MSTNNIYPEANQNITPASLENEILHFWQQEKIFEKSLVINDYENEEEDSVSPLFDSCILHNHSNCNKNEFVFYDGPPFANGLPHYGHLLTGFIKDLFARFQTMQGKKVERKFGWDTHGLPVEMETEKELSKHYNQQISGQLAIQQFGIEKFNSACQKSVMKYANEWKQYVTRQGRFVDFENGYKTMDLNYMESVIWAFKQLYDKGLLYEDFKVVPYSWACQTPLSNFETKMDNAYRQKASKSVTIKFLLQDQLFVNNLPHYLVAWTTTPWTLPSNLALAIGSEIEYTVLKNQNEVLILASASIVKFTKELQEYQSIKTITGTNLIGLKYQPLFPYFANHNKAFEVLSANFVATEDGTGVVHIAPGFGEDDQFLCKQHAIATICPVDEGAKFNNQVFDLPTLSLKNRHVFDTNDDIIKYLKSQNLWLKTEQYLHNYPHCWRTDTPLIYKAVSSWYVKVVDFKDKMVELNQQINWIPSHLKDGQFGNWLASAHDWSITRNRFWGCPVPVWKSASGKIRVFGSIAELEKVSGQKINNLHRPFIDNITFIENNEQFTRVSDVLDCWFESGSMPFAQVHYPFENKNWFENNFPADFITEYVAQTRGWFYTLMVMSTALFNKAPFKNVICHGTILDENSQKLSKRLKNYADPLEIFNIYGSDAMRFYMISQPVMKGQELKIDKKGKAIKETYRLAIKPFLNAFNFFCLYANADGIKANLINTPRQFNNILDQYILSKLKITNNKIEKSLYSFNTISACEEFLHFFEVLNNWYIRRNRQRFWQNNSPEVAKDKQDGYDVLYTILLTMAKNSAPLLPFTAEFIWQKIKP